MTDDNLSPPHWIDLSQCDDVRDVVHRVVACLAQNGVVGLALETVYGLATSALNPQGVARLRELRGDSEPKPLTILVRSAEEVVDWIPNRSAVADRFARRCWPGPVSLVFPRPDPGGLFDSLPAAVVRSISPEGEVALRCPKDPRLRQILRFHPAPLVLSLIHNSQRSPATTAESLRTVVGVDMVVDSGPTLGRAATAVRIDGAQWSIVREGAVDSGTLARLTGMILVFVCTGNTCRSPMAEAVCKVLLARRLGCAVSDLEERGYIVLSAGVAAHPGAPAASHAVEVARSMGGTLEQHQSQPIDLELLRRADHLFTMTQGHLNILLDAAPEAEAIASLLDPDGRDVPDPIGADLSTYRRTAESIERMLSRRLDDLGVPADPSH